MPDAICHRVPSKARVAAVSLQTVCNIRTLRLSVCRDSTDEYRRRVRHGCFPTSYWNGAPQSETSTVAACFHMGSIAILSYKPPSDSESSLTSSSRFDPWKCPPGKSLWFD